MKRNILVSTGAAILVLFCVTAFLAPLISPYKPSEQKLEERLLPPSLQHLFGQDHMGRDILSRVIYGSRISLMVGLVTVAVSAFLGVFIGTIAGFFGGITDEIIMRITDVFMAFPGILLAIAMMAVLGPSLENVIIALCMLGWVGYARLVRGQVMMVRKLEYVLSAEALGAGRAEFLGIGNTTAYAKLGSHVKRGKRSFACSSASLHIPRHRYHVNSPCT